MTSKEYLKENKYYNICNDWSQLVLPPTKLTYGHIALLGRIMNMASDTTDCRASNDVLAGCLCVPNGTIRDWLRKLESENLICKYYDTVVGENNKLKAQRFIKVNVERLNELCPKRNEKNYGQEEKERRKNIKC